MFVRILLMYHTVRYWLSFVLQPRSGAMSNVGGVREFTDKKVISDCGFYVDEER